jgi:hypothetical protein
MARGRGSTSLYVAALALLARTSSAQTSPSPQGAVEAKKACIVQHEAAQNFRRTGKLLEARESILVCLREECPAVVRADCGDWLDVVNKTIPTLVVRANEDDKDVFDVRVSIDGKIVKSQLDGAPIELNPGAHALRFERDHFDPIDQEVLVLEGEKTRVVDAHFARAAPTAPVLAPPKVQERETAPSAETYRPIPGITYVFGGLALAGAGGFAALAISGQSEKKSLESSCRPVCTDEQLEPVRTRFMLADASLGIAIVSTVAAGIIYLTRPTKPLATGASPGPGLRPGSPIAFGVAPTARGAQFAMQTEF